MSFCCCLASSSSSSRNSSRINSVLTIGLITKKNPFSRAIAIIALGAGTVLGSLHLSSAQISKGNQILLSRGLQLGAMVEPADYFHLNVYSNANYTTVDWFHDTDNSQLGDAPGVPWARWVSSITNMPPQGNEGPYLSQLVMLELGDEWNIDDDATRTTLVNWFNAVQTNFPGTILFHNNYGGQASDSALGDVLSRAHPDMLFFDTYPFTSDYTTGTPQGGPFVNWFGDLWRYRQFGIGYSIPFGTYMQTFHSVEDYDQRIYRNPSPSEMRLNTFAALAFNAKALIGFTYNNGATSLFDILPNGYSGDTYTNALYIEQTDVNRRATNLGKALVCLKPIYDMHNTNTLTPPPGPGSTDPNFPNGTTTSILILKGKTLSGGATNYNPLPVGFQSDPQETGSLQYSWWEATKNDLYLNGWAVTNKAGVNNNGLIGDVAIAWFTPIDESLDGPTYSNEVYFMVVNELTATNGTAADCLQEIKLNFLVGTTGPSAVNMLDPETGLVTTNTMPVLAGSGSSTKRQLVLDLNGGDAALFKFADGAPFVGRIPPAQPKLSVSSQGGMPLISTKGTQGARYQLQATTALGSGNWTTLTNLLLPSTNFTYLDSAAPSGSGRFYRAVGIP